GAILVMLPRREAPGDCPVLRGRTARLSRGRGNGARLPAPVANARGSGPHAPPWCRRIVDYLPVVGVLHGQGAACAFRGPLPSLPDASGGGQMTPLRVSVVAAAAALVLLFVIFELIRSR